MSVGTAVSRPFPSTAIFTGQPWYMTAVLIGSDAFALVLSVLISVAAKAVFQGGIAIGGYLQLWPFLFVFLVVYGSIGLYSTVSSGPPDELRRATVASTVLFVCLAAVTVSIRNARQHFTWTLFLAVILTIALVPLVRECARQMFCREPWWGYPTVVFGSGKVGEMVVRAMLKEPGLGLKPVVVLDDQGTKTHVHGVPVYGAADLAPVLLPPNRTAYAVFAMPDVSQQDLLPMIERYGMNFSHVLVIPELTNFASLWVQPRSVGGMLGLELRQQVSRREHQYSKRTLDLLLCLLAAPLLIPLFAALALAVRFDSRGSVFYSQRRIGYGGRNFKAWKFRSMVSDADAVLEQHLKDDSALREEWERDHKLKNDPRVTRVGRFLRKLSLDELPQLWNVVTGEMSLVGPRPIVDKEVVRYGGNFELYTRVKGGITGLWQVSGRNDTSYDERVQLDVFYVRNWSVWLDLCILFRTIAVVLLRKGAY